MSKISQAVQVRDRWLDPALAAVALVAFEIEILTSEHRSGPLPSTFSERRRSRLHWSGGAARRWPTRV
jgi:hypothetical protein